MMLKMKMTMVYFNCVADKLRVVLRKPGDDGKPLQSLLLHIFTAACNFLGDNHQKVSQLTWRGFVSW